MAGERNAARRASALGLLVALGAGALASCSSLDKSAVAYSQADAPASGAPQPAQAALRERLLTRNASQTVVVPVVAEAVAAATRAVEQVGGYVSDSQVGKEAPAHLSLRVPADRLTQALDAFAALGEERSRSVSSADVTEEVGDAEAELANQRALRDRLRALLQRAKDVKEVLSVEAELTRVQTRIDSLEGRLERLRKDVALSAVSLQLVPKEAEKPARILGPLGYLWVGTKWFVTRLFVIRE
jgi:hypothetical protein